MVSLTRKGSLMWEESKVPGEKQCVQAGNHPTLSYTITIYQGDRNQFAAVRSECIFHCTTWTPCINSSLMCLFWVICVFFYKLAMHSRMWYWFKKRNKRIGYIKIKCYTKILFYWLYSNISKTWFRCSKKATPFIVYEKAADFVHFISCSKVCVWIHAEKKVFELCNFYHNNALYNSIMNDKTKCLKIKLWFVCLCLLWKKRYVSYTD